MARLLGVPPKAPSDPFGLKPPPTSGVDLLGIPPVAPPNSTGGGGVDLLGIPPQALPSPYGNRPPPPPHWLPPPLIDPRPGRRPPPPVGLHPYSGEHVLIPPVRRLMQAILAMHYGVNPNTAGY